MIHCLPVPTEPPLFKTSEEGWVERSSILFWVQAAGLGGQHSLLLAALLEAVFHSLLYSPVPFDDQSEKYIVRQGHYHADTNLDSFARSPCANPCHSQEMCEANTDTAHCATWHQPSYSESKIHRKIRPKEVQCRKHMNQQNGSLQPSSLL